MFNPDPKPTRVKRAEKSTAALKTLAIKKFNAWIRKRDQGRPCINCGEYRTLQAGHYFAAGKHENLRFNENNVHGECRQCNYYNSQSHAHGYRKRLIEKIGQAEFDKLELWSKVKSQVKADRFLYLEIIEKYK